MYATAVLAVGLRKKRNSYVVGEKEVGDDAGHVATMIKPAVLRFALHPTCEKKPGQSFLGLDRQAGDDPTYFRSSLDPESVQQLPLMPRWKP
jgi:hypothetical protein